MLALPLDILEGLLQGEPVEFDPVWVLSALVGIALAAGISRLIVGPLGRCVAALDRIGRGDLTTRIKVESKDEIGRLSETLNRTAAAVSGMVGKVHTSSDLLASASDRLSDVSAQLSASAEEASAQVSTVSDSADRPYSADEPATTIRGVSLRRRSASMTCTVPSTFVESVSVGRAHETVG